MPRDFCLFCGEPSTEAEGTPSCGCEVSPQAYRGLLRLEKDHLAAYHAARPLSVNDLSRLIQSGGDYVPVQELLRVLEHPSEVIKELAMRATDRGVMQLVYERHSGSRLLFWPWA